MTAMAERASVHNMTCLFLTADRSSAKRGQCRAKWRLPFSESLAILATGCCDSPRCGKSNKDAGLDVDQHDYSAWLNHRSSAREGARNRQIEEESARFHGQYNLEISCVGNMQARSASTLFDASHLSRCKRNEYCVRNQCLVWDLS